MPEDSVLFIPYLLCYAAAGTHISFHCIHRRNEEEPFFIKKIIDADYYDLATPQVITINCNLIYYFIRGNLTFFSPFSTFAEYSQRSRLKYAETFIFFPKKSKTKQVPTNTYPPDKTILKSTVGSVLVTVVANCVRKDITLPWFEPKLSFAFLTSFVKQAHD